jgi:hypothetical protein
MVLAVRGARLASLFCLVSTMISPAARADDGFRPLAPGVLTVIPADTAIDDPLQRGSLVEITEGQAGIQWVPQRAATNTTFVSRGERVEYPRDIWCLEFAFKPPRTLDVDIPAGDLKMRRTTVHYLVYRVKNVGGRRVVTTRHEAQGELDPVERSVEPFEKPVKFLPQFVLETREGIADGEGISAYRAYLDRLVPSAMDAIREREDPARPLLDSASMSAGEIAPGEERWGVAIWEAVDPRIDYFSIYVRGLTNAIRWRKREGRVIQPADPPGEHIEQTLKSLRLDFWRPGDLAGEKIAVGYRGMFERMALGGRVLAALGWPGHTSSRPQVGLQRLGIAWDDQRLREPAGLGGASLSPLVGVFDTLAKVDDIDRRSLIAREIFGDVGVRGIEELAAAAAGPVEPARDRERRQAMQPMGLTPQLIEAKPLESLAKIARSLESSPDLADRRAKAAAIFGAAAPRLDWLARAAVFARALAAIDASEADPAAMGPMDAREAFEAISDAIAAAPQPDRMAEALFGPEGPELLAEGRAMHEGETHSWGFRYED